MSRDIAPIHAAGGVVWRHTDGRAEVALVHRPRYRDWSLPKGKVEPGEAELAAAVREVGEEIGARVAVSRRLARVSYRVGKAHKSVAYWTMRYLDGEFRATDEVDGCEWMPVDAARDRLSYDADRTVLKDFAALPMPESVVLLVRHAKAGKRSQWKDDDALRPLESSGRAQARRLADFLVRFAPVGVRSAEPVRCVQTVAPLAERLGVATEVDPVFGDESHARHPDAAVAALLALAVPGRVEVVCSQGETIPAVLSTLAPSVEHPKTRKGAVWVLCLVDGTVLAADYYAGAAR